LYTDIVVPPSDVKLSKECASRQLVDDLRDKGQNISIMNGPSVKRSIVLYRTKLAILLFDKEEVGCIWASRFADGTTLQVFLNELVAFHDFFLGEWEETSRECGGGAMEELNGVIPDRMSRQSL
jgi:hypothetical protein